MIDEHTFQSVIIINTIVAGFSIILLITLTLFIIVFLIPSIRRQWFTQNKKEENEIVDILPLTRQSSFQNSPLGSFRFNPIFERTAGTTTPTNTQFGTLFHPQASIATFLHPTIWTSMSPTSLISSPLTTRSTPTSPPSIKSVVPPPLPTHPPTTTTSATTTTTTPAQRSPKKR